MLTPYGVNGNGSYGKQLPKHVFCTDGVCMTPNRLTYNFFIQRKD